MTKRAKFVLAAVLLSVAGLSLEAQDAPPPPPAGPAIAAPVAPGSRPIAPSPVLAPAPGALIVAPALVTVAPLPPGAPSAQIATTVAPAAVSAPLPPQQPEVSIFYAGGNFLGVHAEEITRENMGHYGLTGEPRGVGVREVLKGSPAERAGLRANDVILRFDGEAVTSVRKLNRLIDESSPEHAARLTIRRGGSEQELTVALGKREVGSLMGSSEEWRRQAEEWQKNGEQMRKYGDEVRKQMEDWRRNNPGVFSMSFGGSRRIGVSTNALGKQLADYFGVAGGVLITSVEEGSPAASAGLKAGDIVTEVDGEKIDESGDLSRAINRKEEGDVTLTVVRDRNRRTVKVTPEKRKSPAIELMPGSFRIETPRIAIAAPDINISLPPIHITPRIKTSPKVKVIAPGRIL